MLVIGKPGTVIAWHRQGFPAVVDLEESAPPGATGRRHPHANSHDGTGEPAVWRAADSRRIAETRDRRLLDHCGEIHGRPRQPPSQTWRTFLRNHLGIVVADFFVVPTVT